MKIKAVAGPLNLVKVYRSVVPTALIRDVLRCIYLDVRERGVSREDIASWYAVGCPFPHLRFTPEVEMSQDYVQRRCLGAFALGQACEPQLIWHLPDYVDAETPARTSHLDQEPPWAEGRRYLVIAGVALTPWTYETGGLCVFDGRARPVDVMLDAGDVVVMSPDVEHSPGINRSGLPRHGVYYRWLAQAEVQ